jgi:ABC-type uncharacterized transport system permease subunit
MSRSPLVHGLRVARALFTSQYALMLEYRAEIALWALSGVLPLIMLVPKGVIATRDGEPTPEVEAEVVGEVLDTEST